MVIHMYTYAYIYTYMIYVNVCIFNKYTQTNEEHTATRSSIYPSTIDYHELKVYTSVHMLHIIHRILIIFNQAILYLKQNFESVELTRYAYTMYVY